jgi:hypothetical protein
VSPSFSSVGLNSTESSGTGLDPTLPWDYFYLNSVDKGDAGDNLISARHTSTIYQISGANGAILWQLDSSNATSSFTLANGLNFSYQHDACLRYQNVTAAILIIFDNAADGFNSQSALYSSGLLVAINHRTSTTTLLQRYLPPELFTSSSQGNAQILRPLQWKTSNVYVCCGQNAYICEYTSKRDDGAVGTFRNDGRDALSEPESQLYDLSNGCAGNVCLCAEHEQFDTVLR